MKPRISWHNHHLHADGSPRRWKPGSVRDRAARSADLNVGSRKKPEWQVYFNAYVSGWIAANRIAYPQIRAELQRQLFMRAIARDVNRLEAENEELRRKMR